MRSRCGSKRTIRHSPGAPLGQYRLFGPHAQDDELLNTLQAGFKYIENESFQSTFSGLFSEINLGSDKLGKSYADRNAKLCTIITKIAEGLAEFSTDGDTLGDAYEYLIGEFAAGSGKKAGEFYTPQRISDILSAIVTLDSQEPKTGQAQAPRQRHGFCLRLGVAPAQCAQAHGAARDRQDLWAGEEHHHVQPRAYEHAAAWGEGFAEFEIYHGDTLTNEWDMLREHEPGDETVLRRRGCQPAIQLPLEPE